MGHYRIETIKYCPRPEQPIGQCIYNDPWNCWEDVRWHSRDPRRYQALPPPHPKLDTFAKPPSISKNNDSLIGSLLILMVTFGIGFMGGFMFAVVKAFS